MTDDHKQLDPETVGVLHGITGGDFMPDLPTDSVPQPSRPSTITLPIEDVQLALYLKPSIKKTARGPECAYCGQPAGAHYCTPHVNAKYRIERAVSRALDDLNVQRPDRSSDRAS